MTSEWVVVNNPQEIQAYVWN